MQNLVPHITYLLTKHECVILPGLGALVVYSVNAKQHKESNVFISPIRAVGFNSDLKHNDGLLAGLLMRERMITFNEANLVVLQFCENLRFQVESRGKAILPMIGTFSRLDDNKLAFIPESHLSANASLYGFSNFHLSLLSDIAENTHHLRDESDVVVHRKKKDVLWIPINKKALKTIGATAAAVIAMLLFTTPIDDKRVPSQYASVVNPFNVEIKNQTELTDQLIKDAETMILPATDSLAAVRDSNAIPSNNNITLVTPNQPDRYYYIVVGSFPTKKQASKILTDVQSEFGNATILDGSQWHWIYVDKFEKKQDADQFLRGFHQKYTNYKDAWILGRRVRL